MVKLTAELIEQSAQYTNPLRDRELDLRGRQYSIPVDGVHVGFLFQIPEVFFNFNFQEQLRYAGSTEGTTTLHLSPVSHQLQHSTVAIEGAQW